MFVKPLIHLCWQQVQDLTHSNSREISVTHTTCFELASCQGFGYKSSDGDYASTNEREALQVSPIPITGIPSAALPSRKGAVKCV